MNFEDIPYQRPDIDTILHDLSMINAQLDQTHLTSGIIPLFQKQNNIHIDFITRMRIAEIRNLADLKNEFYAEEVLFLIDARLKIETLQLEFYKTLLSKRAIPELENHLGSNFFVIIKAKVAQSTPDAAVYQKQELHLINDYQKMTNRKTEAGDLFIQLIEVRKKIAIHSNFKNYTDYCYAKKGTAYTRSEILTICQNVRAHFSAVNSYHNEIKTKKPGVSRVNFKTSNTITSALNSIDDMTLFMDRVSRLLHTASDAIADHFDVLYQSHFIDYRSRDNKYPMSMNVGLPAIYTSFIFATLDPAGANVVTLLHEIGHAFQFYQSLGQIKIAHEYMRPSADIAEMQACTLELLFYDDYSLLFHEKAPIVQFILFEKMLFFILKSCAYEELQQFIYATEILTIEIINREWLSIRERYYPYMDADYFEGDAYYLEGNEWQLNFQIFTNPFNEINYTIAYLHALDQLQNYRVNKKETMKNFELLCSLGGSVTYPGAMDICSLTTLDTEDKVKTLADTMRNELAGLSIIFTRIE